MEVMGVYDTLNVGLNHQPMILEFDQPFQL